MRRYVAYLTRAQRDAVLEALSSRLAGPIEGGDNRVETYEAAETAIATAKLQLIKTGPPRERA